MTTKLILVKADTDKYFLYREDPKMGRIPEFHKLSKKNCIEIEQGQNLGTLAMEFIGVPTTEYNDCDMRVYNAVMYGFKKCLQMTEEELQGAFELLEKCYNNPPTKIETESDPDYEILSEEKLWNEDFRKAMLIINPNEWEVVLETEDSFKKTDEKYVDEIGSGNFYEHSKQPKLDENGCVILRRL